ncbi:hypothetical protein ACFSTE_15790 [Aquimarina hainanensis]|uniref:Uncharacterized protein n=1 Tax=Aquimarina hainanensis TaxID=1578017 RepID=A0ABW5NA45_9FLAO
MNHVKDNPVGVDVLIQELQTKLYERLSFENIEGFGRVYLDERHDSIVPVHYAGNGEHTEVLIDDRYTLRYFFVENETTESQMTMSATEVDIIFLVNLEKAYPDIKHRADEEFKREIYRLFRKTRFFYLSKMTITKGKEALEDFKHNLIDMQPYHFIRFRGEIKYQLDH